MPDRHVVFVLFPGAQLLDLSGPADVFAAATHILAGDRPRAPGYRISVTGPERSTPTATGVTVQTTAFAKVRGPIDTLVVPGGLAFAEQTFDADALAWCERAAARARRVVSICTGAFVLARLGLLDNRRATTHWLAQGALAARAPRCRVEKDALYVKDNDLYTSAGVSAGIDLALALVEEDHDRELSLAVARALVMFLRRPGGQSQFSEALRTAAPQHRGIRAALDALMRRPDLDHRVDAMAHRAGMSPRHFVRVFTDQTGDSPARYVQRIRLERARQLLEESDEGLEGIAAACGFGTAETMRRTFRRDLAVSPAGYRARFSRD